MKYGFELEGFAVSSTGVAIPPKSWSTDGFPGLVEFRTIGGDTIEKQLGSLVTEIISLPKQGGYAVDWGRTEFKFSAEQMAEMRKTRHFDKCQVDVQNIYGKSPRRLGNLTIASFQINISNQITTGYTEKKIEMKTIVERHRPATYGLLDVHGIVKRLDLEFSKEIKDSGRQPGMYAIKENIRLEYRSLPNSVFKIDRLSNLAERIRSAVEGKKEE